MISKSTSRRVYLLLLFYAFGLICSSHGKSLQFDEDHSATDCFNPSGVNCNWYRECLEKRYKCDKTSYPYAITFAEHFCLKYGKTYNSFTVKGQQWIDATRKCLQVSLVPLLNPSIVPTCKEIRTFGFKTHTHCYLSPSPQVTPSVCHLPFFDWLRIFHTIKSAFIKVAVPSIKGAIGTLAGCAAKGK